MKQLTVLSCLVLAIVATSVLIQPARLYAAPRIGQASPNFKVTTTAGQQISLERLSGNVVVLDFFATWCQPCRASIPHLNELDRKYGKRGLMVLGMSADDESEKGVRIFVDQNHIAYPVALAGETVLTDFSVRSVPIMYIIDKRGKVAGVFRGFTEEVGRSTDQLINRLLAEK
jgi:peroxiredoxin